MSPKREGFWKSTQEPDLPMPVEREKEAKNKQEVLACLDKFEARATERAFRGWSTCRICKKANGSVTYAFRGWEWPSGLQEQ